MSHKGNMAFYSGIKTAVDLIEAIEDFCFKYEQSPTRIMVHSSASHLPEIVEIRRLGTWEIEMGTKALTPPNEHVFLFLKEGVKSGPLDDFANTD